MSDSKENTFRAYDAQQAQKYSVHRGSYPCEIFDAILKYHKDTGGKFDQLLDVGCGPGNATEDMARYFERAVGIDGSKELVKSARLRAGKAGIGPIKYEVANAEECNNVPGLAAESVDLVTAAMAAHWFNMSEFWPNVATILKSGGTVALWTVSSMYCHPSTPNAEAVQKILFELERDMLAPYELPGNRISRDMYDNLDLPWTISPRVACFDPESHIRKEWNRDGRLEANGVFLMAFDGPTSLQKLQEQLGTASMVTRWREANRDLRGTDKDCVRITISKLRDVLKDDKILLSGSTALLLFKKK